MIYNSKNRQWLIASFEPFAGRKQNNSMLVMEEIKKLEVSTRDEAFWAFQFHYLVLPVEYENCFKVLDQKVTELQKMGVALHGILGIGEGAEEFKLEGQAHNLDDVAELADNAGDLRSNRKIFPEFPESQTFPLRFPFEAFNRIRPSDHAGFFICNHLCAEMSVNYGKNDKIPYFGFIHVPKVGSGGMFTADICASVIVNGFKKIKL